MKNKILFISNSIVGKNPGISGGESRFIELGKNWQKKGYEIHLMSSESGKILCEKMGLKVILHRIPSSYSEGRWEIIKRTIQLLFYVPTILEEFKEGIVYSTSEQIYDVWPGVFLKLYRGKNIKFVSAVHWLPPWFFWLRKSSTWLNSMLFLMSERAGLYLAFIFSDKLFPVSKDTFYDMKKNMISGNKIHIVKCGVNIDEIIDIKKKVFGTKGESHKNIVVNKKYDAVFMKRIQRVKGIFDLIEIWEQVVKQKNNASLLIIGSGIDENEAKRIVNEKGLENNVKFTGAVYSAKEKYSYIMQSKLFLLPSYEENWAIVIGESLACGTPVITYNLYELEEVWEDSIEFVELSDISAFTVRVIKLLNDDNVLKDKSIRGQEYIKRYDWKQIADAEIELINK